MNLVQETNFNRHGFAHYYNLEPNTLYKVIPQEKNDKISNWFCRRETKKSNHFFIFCLEKTFSNKRNAKLEWLGHTGKGFLIQSPRGISYISHHYVILKSSNYKFLRAETP